MTKKLKKTKRDIYFRLKHNDTFLNKENEGTMSQKTPVYLFGFDEYIRRTMSVIVVRFSCIGLYHIHSLYFVLMQDEQRGTMALLHLGINDNSLNHTAEEICTNTIFKDMFVEFRTHNELIRDYLDVKELNENYHPEILCLKMYLDCIENQVQVPRVGFILPGINEIRMDTVFVGMFVGSNKIVLSKYIPIYEDGYGFDTRRQPIWWKNKEYTVMEKITCGTITTFEYVFRGTSWFVEYDTAESVVENRTCDVDDISSIDEEIKLSVATCHSI